jgi:hypothetical protein
MTTFLLLAFLLLIVECARAWIYNGLKLNVLQTRCVKLAKVSAVLLINSLLLQTYSFDIAKAGEKTYTITDEISFSEPESLKSVQLSDDEAASRVQRKLERQRQSSGSITDDNGSYSKSLQREKAKQDARKKSKADRAKDLCETLGRGC